VNLAAPRLRNVRRVLNVLSWLWPVYVREVLEQSPDQSLSAKFLQRALGPYMGIALARASDGDGPPQQDVREIVTRVAKGEGTDAERVLSEFTRIVWDRRAAELTVEERAVLVAAFCASFGERAAPSALTSVASRRADAQRRGRGRYDPLQSLTAFGPGAFKLRKLGVQLRAISSAIDDDATEAALAGLYARRLIKRDAAQYKCAAPADLVRVAAENLRLVLDLQAAKIIGRSSVGAGAAASGPAAAAPSSAAASPDHVSLAAPTGTLSAAATTAPAGAFTAAADTAHPVVLAAALPVTPSTATTSTPTPTVPAATDTAPIAAAAPPSASPNAPPPPATFPAAPSAAPALVPATADAAPSAPPDVPRGAGSPAAPDMMVRAPAASRRPPYTKPDSPGALFVEDANEKILDSPYGYPQNCGNVAALRRLDKKWQNVRCGAEGQPHKCRVKWVHENGEGDIYYYVVTDSKTHWYLALDTHFV